jgi:sugar lactone lactonase YvrE
LLVVAMRQRLVLRVGDRGEVSTHCDLSGHAEWPLNDMIVADDGTAYVGHFGFDRQNWTTPRAPASLLRVRPDGSADVVAGDMHFPNGMAITGDGTTLLVAESGAGRITAFDIRGDGTLDRRSVFAEVPVDEGADTANPDGICLDPSGDVWVPDTIGHRLVRLRRGGDVVRSLRIDGDIPLACEVGGTAGDTLFVASVRHFTDVEGAKADRVGRISVLPIA